MSTRGTTFYDDSYDQPDWTPVSKPWCKFCCAPNCGCPNEPPVTDESHIVRGQD